MEEGIERGGGSDMVEAERKRRIQWKREKIEVRNVRMGNGT